MNIYRKDGKLVMEILEEELIDAAKNSEFGQIEITDKEVYLNYFVDNLKEVTNYNENEEDTTLLDGLFIAVLEEAIESETGCKMKDYEGSYN